MTRRRWIYDNDGNAYEVTDQEPSFVGHVDTGVLWNDRLYQDDGDPRYNSRAQHREYMRRNGLSTIDDWSGTWARAAKERERISKGVDPSRVSDMREALAKLQSGYRPRKYD